MIFLVVQVSVLDFYDASCTASEDSATDLASSSAERNANIGTLSEYRVRCAGEDGCGCCQRSRGWNRV